MHSFPETALIGTYALSQESVGVITGLKAQGIILDVQLFNLFKDNPPLRKFFELFLLHLGRPLSVQKLRSALKFAAFEHEDYGPRLEGFDESDWDAISAHLQIDFDLSLIEGEGGEVTIVSAGRFAEMQRGNTALATVVPPPTAAAMVLAGAAQMVQRQMDAYFREQLEKLGRGLITLKTTADEDAFLEALNELLPLMIADSSGSLAPGFIELLMTRYWDFGPKVRLAIVSAFKQLGFDEEMMDAIAALSSKEDRSQIREAINRLILALGRNQDPVQTGFGLMGLYKFLEEAAASKKQNAELAVHALGKLKTIAPLLIEVYRPIKPNQVLDISYKLLNRDPEGFSGAVEGLLAELARHKGAEVEGWLLEREGIAETPAVKLVLLRVLRRISSAENRLVVIGRQVRLYLDNEKTKIGGQLLAEFQEDAGETLSSVIDEFEAVPEAGQLILIRLLDALYPRADPGARGEASGLLADLFAETPVMVAGTISETLRLEALKTGIVLNAAPREMREVFAPALLSRLAVLLADEGFVRGLISASGAYYREFCNAVVDDARTEEERLAIAEVVLEKGRGLESSSGEEGKGHQTATEVLYSGVFKLLRAKLSDDQRRRLFSVLGGLAAIPVIPPGVISEIFEIVEGQMSQNKQLALDALIPFVLRRGEFPPDVKKRLVRSLKIWTDLLIPPIVDYREGLAAGEDRENIKALMRQVLEVYFRLLDREGVPPDVQKDLVDFLMTAERGRPHNKPDDTRDALVATLKRISTSRYLNGRIRRVLLTF